MSEARKIASHLMEDCSDARAHFETWWALRNLAIPSYLSVMNREEYVDFFVATNAAHYKSFFISLAKVFDRDSRAAGLSELKKALRAENRKDLATYLKRKFRPYKKIVKNIMSIRNKAIAHTERSLGRRKVYKIHGVKPDEIREVINTACDAVDHVMTAFGSSVAISDPSRLQKATLSMLRTLK